jgi:hypothetical protein
MTRLRDKIPVPPLDDERLARIERGVLAGADLTALRRPRRSWWTALNLATAAVAVAAAVLAIVVSRRGPATEKSVVAQPALPTQIVTGPGEGAKLVLGDAVVMVGEDTALSVAREADGTTNVNLDRGTVDCEVEPIPNRPPFLVHADDVDVTVVGTAFSVERLESVRVEVTRGVVRVEQGGKSTNVVAGHQWSAGEVVAVVATTIEQPTDQPGTAVATADAPAPGSVAATPDVRFAPGKTPNSDNLAARQSHSPTVAKPDAGVAATPSARAKLLARAPLPRGRAPSGATKSGESLADIMALEADSPRDAARRYGAIAATEKGNLASFALYSQAYVELMKLSDTRAALATARLYERRFPRGREAESLLWLRIRATCKAGKLATCRSAAHSYIRRYADGDNVDIARQIINW